MAGKQCAIIRDGYNFDGDTKKIDDVCPVIKIKFRPMTNFEQAIWLESEEKNKDSRKGIAQSQAETIEKLLVSWDAEEMTDGGKYKPAEINSETLLCLPSEVFSQLLNIVVGFTPRTEKLREEAKSEAKANAKKAIAEAKKTELEESEKN